MKTPVSLPNELVMQAKLQALHQGRTLRDLSASDLRRELAAHNTGEVHPEPIEWVVARAACQPCSTPPTDQASPGAERRAIYSHDRRFISIPGTEVVGQFSRL